MIVAIDGPGGSGKSTVAREVGRRLGLPHLDTGAFYRAATLAVLEAGVDPEDTDAVVDLLRQVELDYDAGHVLLDGRHVEDRIRDADVTASVSAVSAIPEVRRLLVRRQRDWVARHGGSAVVEGRDIGTVVFPDADLKIYLTARPEVRAARRAAELGLTEEQVVQVAEALARRDAIDSRRPVSPLRPAEDAIVIDTSDLSVEEVVERIVALARQRAGSAGGTGPRRA